MIIVKVDSDRNSLEFDILGSNSNSSVDASVELAYEEIGEVEVTAMKLSMVKSIVDRPRARENELVHDLLVVYEVYYSSMGTLMEELECLKRQCMSVRMQQRSEYIRIVKESTVPVPV